MKIDLVIDATCVPRARVHGTRHAALETLFARGDALALETSELESCLRVLFDIPRGRTLPVAALSLLGDGFDPAGDYWLRLEPVHLRADRSHLLLVSLPPNDIAPAEAEALQTVLAPHLARDGYELHAGTPQRWYARAPRRLDLQTHAPQDCIGVLDERHLPSGADGASLRRLVTEAQMLLHALPMNETREASGKLAVNGIWPWGGGSMIAIPNSHYSRAFSDDPVVRGMARASAAQAMPLPRAADELLAQQADSDDPLVVCGTTGESLADIERRWVAPFAGELGRGRIEELRLLLIGRDGGARTITRRHLRRWWRRSRPLASYD
jgi:hypothetical protein